MTDHIARHLLRRTALAAVMLLAAAPAALADTPAYLFLDFDHQKPAASAPMPPRQRNAADQGVRPAASPHRPAATSGTSARMMSGSSVHRSVSTAPAP